MIADPILVGIAVGRTLDAIAIIGYFIFEPKYIELQFRVAPGIASIGISVLLLAWGTGIALGGLLIRWLKLRLAGIAMLITVATLIQVFGYSSMMLISCDPVDLRGLDGPTCAQSCECTLEQLAPVCDEAAQQSYVSACAAGCNTFDGNLTYTDCGCLSKGVGRSGYCEEPCTAGWYLLMASLNAVFATIPIVGSLMLTLRVAGSERKAMANGIVTLSVTLFGMLPGPPIVGTIVDSTCALWSSDACDSSADGNCLFFDTDQLRIRLLSFVAALRLITAGVDLFVFFKVRSRNIVEVDEGKPEADQANGDRQSGQSVPTAGDRSSDADDDANALNMKESNNSTDRSDRDDLERPG